MVVNGILLPSETHLHQSLEEMQHLVLPGQEQNVRAQRGLSYDMLSCARINSVQLSGHC